MWCFSTLLILIILVILFNIQPILLLFTAQIINKTVYSCLTFLTYQQTNHTQIKTNFNLFAFLKYLLYTLTSVWAGSEVAKRGRL